MFQREVAERIVARPGSEHYGRLSVLAAWRSTAKILFDVNRSAFVPPPSVTSSMCGWSPWPSRRAGAAEGPGTGHRRRLWPAPQDAAAEPQDAGR